MINGSDTAWVLISTALVMLMTAPEIGNVGVNLEDYESAHPFCAGFVVRNLSPRVSNWRAQGDLAEFMAKHGVAGIAGIDTRAITRRLRIGGAQRAVITRKVDDPAGAVERARKHPSLEGRDLVKEYVEAARAIGARRGTILCKNRIAVLYSHAGAPKRNPGGALAQRPGRPVAVDGFGTEAFDFCRAHAGEIIPLFIVRAGMGEAEPQIAGEVFVALGHAIGAFLAAAVYGTRAHLRRRREHPAPAHQRHLRLAQNGCVFFRLIPLSCLLHSCFDPPTLKLRRASDQSLVRRSAAKAGKLSMRGI